MTITLESATRRAAEALKSKPAPILPASAYMLSGAELARECASAVRSYPPSRALTDAERDALAAMLAATVTERMGRGRTRDQVRRNGASRTPADVLRYVARCERFPALMAGREGIPRSAVGREYLRRECASMMRDSREWRDVAESYQTRANRDASAPMIESADSYADADHLTVAQAREVERTTGEPLPAMPIMSADVAQGMALALSVQGASRTDVEAAILMGAGVPTASIALALGASLSAIQGRTRRGAAWLRSHYSAGELVALMAETADAYGHTLPADYRPGRSAYPPSPTMPAAWRSASDAVDRAKRTARRMAELAGQGC